MNVKQKIEDCLQGKPSGIEEIIGMTVIGKSSGQIYKITGISFHPDNNGEYRRDYCEGFILSENGIVHLDGLIFPDTLEREP